MARGDSDSEHPYGMNEVDDFAQKRGEILLNKSTLRDRRSNYDSDEELADNGEEEIMGIDESDEDSESDHEVKDSDVYRKVFGKRMESVESDEELSEEDGNLEWGATKNDYYGADELDDDDEAKEIEKEALRQQKLNMEELHMQDFLDDEVENEWVKKAKDYDMEKFNESTNMKTTGDGSMEDIKNIFNMTEEAKKTFIQTAFPEFFPLSIEYTNLNNKLNELNKLENSDSHVISIKKSALNAYIGVIASYFAIFLNELKNNLEDFHTMKDHPVMESILTLKEIWRQANELPNEMEIDSEEDGEQEFGSMDQEQDFGVGENEDEDAEVSEIDEDILAATMPIDNEGDSSEEEDGEQDSEGDDEEEEEEDDEEENDFGIDLTASRVASSKDAKKKKTAIVDNDFLEADINEVDASEKKARKKTLRFYTSKIDQADLKKLERFKGDDDVPYKERLFERQQRLLEEARKRGLKNGGSDEHDLDNNDMDSDDEKIASKINSQGENDYYNQIKAGRVHKKETREKAHKEAVQAAKEGKLAELAEDIGEDGKRAINYQILKNKGLTPKRHKDNRNSRVKKRKKYEKAQKKLKSVRAVYSGGQSGSYEGEKTGIKKNLVKSVKFRS